MPRAVRCGAALALLTAGLCGCSEAAQGEVPTRSQAADVTDYGDDTDFTFVQQDASDDTQTTCEGCVDLLCAPCLGDDECGEGARCLPFGEAGRFCGRACTDETPCPADFKCTSVSFRSNVPGQCMPLSGACACTPDAIAAAATTSCMVTNSFGQCPGTRSCAATGLQPCDGPAPTAELCNGDDDDCDGDTDEGFALGTPCGGACSPLATLLCAADGKGTMCSAPPKEPQTETCDNTDDDCDGLTDEGCDDDDDDVCDAAMVVTGVPTVCKKGGGDCDDLQASVHPGLPERCESSIDDNCDGDTNSLDAVGCTAFWFDGDDDGSGGPGEPSCYCTSPGEDWVTLPGDCDDLSAAVGALAEEVCGNNIDDDCDGDTDEDGALGCFTRYPDADNDGVGALASPICTCNPELPGTASGTGDCDDNSELVRPGLPESCDNLDNDCDGDTDGFTAPCPSGCGEGISTCIGGVLSGCDGVVPACTPGPCCVLGCPVEPCVVETTHTLCIDAGYGGSQPGPVNGALVGKDITLDVASRLQTLLAADTAKPAGGGAWKVIMTRTTDVALTVEERVAACAGAERVVSIMANACGCTTATGMETYTVVSPSPTASDLAEKLQAQAVAQAGIKDRGVKAKDWALLTGAAAPGTQTYLGFVDGTVDAPLLASDLWRQKVALGLLYGLQLHFGYTSFAP